MGTDTGVHDGVGGQRERRSDGDGFDGGIHARSGIRGPRTLAWRAGDDVMGTLLAGLSGPDPASRPAPASRDRHCKQVRSLA